ncbi:MAG TPA: DUF6644 family protein [Caulobacteraceae bacterium]|nr:DUF6644 family protein [Caulobacteraceae bacterium]
MSLHDLWSALEQAPFAVLVRQNELVFPWIESVHVLAIVLVVGTVFIVDLRLLGVASRGRPVTQLAREVLPCTWAAYGLAACTGFLLFSSSAVAYANDLPFRLKMLTMALAGVNMLVFHFVPYRDVAHWDRSVRTPVGVRAAAGISMICWIAIVGFGRWVGFSLN